MDFSISDSVSNWVVDAGAVVCRNSPARRIASPGTLADVADEDAAPAAAACAEAADSRARSKSRAVVRVSLIWFASSGRRRIEFAPACRALGTLNRHSQWRG